MARRTRRPRRPPDEYEVGYGKPPVATRFKKGQSGNGRGRPKKSRRIVDQLQDILDGKITIRNANGTRKATVLEAVLRKQIDNALKGDPRSLLAITRLVQQGEHGRGQDARNDPEVLDEDDEALISDYMVRRATPDGEGGSS